MKTLLKISLTLSTILCLTSLQAHAMNGNGGENGAEDQLRGTITLSPASQPNPAEDTASAGALTRVVLGIGLLTKKGTGTLTLLGSNGACYTGATIVEHGQFVYGQFVRVRRPITGTDKVATKDDEKKTSKN